MNPCPGPSSAVTVSFTVPVASATVGDRMRWLFMHIPLHTFHNWPLWFRRTVLAFLSSLMPLTADPFLSVTLYIWCLLILRLNCHLGHKYTGAIFIFIFRSRQAWRFIQKAHIIKFQFSRKLAGKEKPVCYLVCAWLYTQSTSPTMFISKHLQII